MAKKILRVLPRAVDSPSIGRVLSGHPPWVLLALIKTHVLFPSPSPSREVGGHVLGQLLPSALSGHRLRRSVGPPVDPLNQPNGGKSRLGVSVSNSHPLTGAGSPDMRLHRAFRQFKSPRCCQCPIRENWLSRRS